MAVKSANVMARVEPEIKKKAEAIIEQLGLPVSAVINALYRQIVMNNGIPFPLTIPRTLPNRDELTEEEFSEIMSKGLIQAKSGQGADLDEAFAKIESSLTS